LGFYKNTKGSLFTRCFSSLFSSFWAFGSIFERYDWILRL